MGKPTDEFLWLPAKDGGGVKAWMNGVPFDGKTTAQLLRCASMPIIYKWVAAMPDAHFGMGSTVGSVIPTKGAIVPASVGVDIGCGMHAYRTAYTANDLPDSLKSLRTRIEGAVPHGRSHGGGPQDCGSWRETPDHVGQAFLDAGLQGGMARILTDTPKLNRIRAKAYRQLGTLGGGNHFIEVCLDQDDRVWAMLHSGSRYPGNAIGQHFTRLAKQCMKDWFIKLPDVELAYISQRSPHFSVYMRALQWAQLYARTNRNVMMQAVLGAIERELNPENHAKVWKPIEVNCHHNYVAMEEHFGQKVFVTRKGAVRAQEGDMGIIPGSMGARSYIVRGLGNRDSFCSCSHGAGRTMSRGDAKRRFTVEDHEAATEGVECRKDRGVLDETPMAYKPIDKVMAAQRTLVEPVHVLKQVVCVKG